MSKNISMHLLIIDFVQKPPGIRHQKKIFCKRWMFIQTWVYPWRNTVQKSLSQQPGRWSGTLCWVTKANFKRSLLYDSRHVKHSQNDKTMQNYKHRHRWYSGEHSCLPDIKQISGLGWWGGQLCAYKWIERRSLWWWTHSVSYSAVVTAICTDKIAEN